MKELRLIICTRWYFYYNNFHIYLKAKLRPSEKANETNTELPLFKTVHLYNYNMEAEFLTNEIQGYIYSVK